LHHEEILVGAHRLLPRPKVLYSTASPAAAASARLPAPAWWNDSNTVSPATVRGIEEALVLILGIHTAHERGEPPARRPS
jgi:hypothetical protein